MIKTLKQQGMTDTAIAEYLGIDRKTVSKYKNNFDSPKYERKKGKTKLDEYKDYIEGRLSKYNITSVKLYEEIQKQGFTGKYGIVNLYVRKTKKKLKQEAVIRFETLPGEQAQVDWGFCGEIYDPEQKQFIKLNCFLMVLGFSRMKYIEFFPDASITSFLKGHNNAFKYFGGYTKEILYDNLKSVVIKRKIRAKDSDFNKKFMDFAGYYGINPILARPYKPNTKGKVENSVNYVKQNFLCGEEFKSLKEINNKALEWLSKVNNMIHGTTKEKPIDRLKKENLISIENRNMYDITPTFYRKVSIDCHFSYNGNFYSVPYKYANKEVSVKEIEGKIVVKYRDDLIAEHEIINGFKGKYITNAEHIKGLKELRTRNSILCYKKKKKKEEKNLLYSKVNKYYEDVEKRDLKTYEIGG